MFNNRRREVINDTSIIWTPSATYQICIKKICYIFCYYLFLTIQSYIIWCNQTHLCAFSIYACVHSNVLPTKSSSMIYLNWGSDGCIRLVYFFVLFCNLPPLILSRTFDLSSLVTYNYGSCCFVEDHHFQYISHWGRDKWTPFRRRHFQIHFLEWKWLNSD